MDNVKIRTAERMTEQYFEMKEIYGDSQQRVVHPDMGEHIVSFLF